MKGKESMQAKNWRLIAAVVGSLVLGGIANATVVTVVSNHDNTLFEDPLGLLSNGVGQYMFVGETAQSNSRRGVLSFDIAAAVPAGATINSVSLQMHCSRSVTGNRTVNLHRVTTGWGEGASDAGEPGGSGATPEVGDATWLHTFYPGSLWANEGGDFVSTVSASRSIAGAGFYTWATTPALVTDVQAWLNSPGTNYGWLLLGQENGTTSAKRLDTHEHVTPEWRPQLTIDYTPVPEPISLAGFALLGVVALGRRR